MIELMDWAHKADIAHQILQKSDLSPSLTSTSLSLIFYTLTKSPAHCDGGFRKAVMSCGRQLHTTVSRDGSTETLKRRITELEKMRRSKKSKKRDDIFVQVPESLSFLDTATMPMILTVVGTALFAKLLMMHDDSHSQEMIERKIKNAPVGQGTVRKLTREEWVEFREVRPRTPFESRLARPNARIRTEEPVRMEDLKDWTIDVLTDALTRVEESVKRNS